jgi:DNA-binding response OmpR family regulator
MLKASFCRVDEGMNKVSGLGFGADDYMTKPFHKDELVARIHAIVRRSKGHAQSVVCFSWHGCAANRSARRIRGWPRQMYDQR